MDEASSSLKGLLGSIFEQAGSHTSDTDGHASAKSEQGPADPNARLLSLIRQARSRIDSLSLISDNDTVEDLPTSSLRAVLLDSVYAQLLSRSSTTPGDLAARKDVLRRSKDAYRAYLGKLLSLQILDTRASARYVTVLANQAKDAIAQDRAPFPDNASGRRAAKIAAMKLERALTSSLDEFRKAVRAKLHVTGGSVRSTTSGLSTASAPLSQQVPEVQYDLLVFSSRQVAAGEGDEDEDEDDEGDSALFAGTSASDENGISMPKSTRSYLVMLCNLHALHSLSALDGIYTEMQLLSNMPSDHNIQARDRAVREEAESRRRDESNASDDWRIEQRWGASNNAPLLNDKGKPMRPFTILPGEGNTSIPNGTSSGLGSAQAQIDQRQRLRQQVFQPSHRLPTMTIDEYLAEEDRRGNIIRGGGQASAEAPTSKETLALRSEGGNGVSTVQADEADEEQRRKAMEWDDFTEANPKGIGNTMNRG